MSSDFFASIVDELKDEDVSLASEGEGSAEFGSYIDTGCLVLNAAVSGSIFGGMPDNKVLVLAGESSTGKTFVALGIVAHFLAQHPTGGVIYYDTESAVTKAMMEARDIDTRRVIIGEPTTLQDFRTKALAFLDLYSQAKDRPPLLMVLDSLGALSSSKEMADSAAGADTRDMTKAQLVRAIFRVLRLKLSKLHVPMIVTGHTYAAVGSYVPMQVLSGGGGIHYASDSIVFLSKKKDKDKTTKETKGVFLTGRMFKSRLSRENQDVEMRLSYETGLDRYYGLLDLCIETGLIEQKGSWYVFSDQTKAQKKDIEENPEKYWTPEVLAMIEDLACKQFRYGRPEVPIPALPDHDPETGELRD